MGTAVTSDAPRKIAIVDDDREVREMLREVLEEQGYSVLHAPSGLRLIAILSVDRPDLILLDVRMSWVDGFALCRALKSHSSFFRDIPVCFVSAVSSPERVKEGLACGAAAYLTKPFELERLLATVRELVDHPVSAATNR